MSLNQKKAVFLVLLDLLAAFDMVDRTILLKWVESQIGLRDLALDWVKSYLLQRQQHISVATTRSKSQELNQGVPQGSVLGPILFSIYTLPLGDIVRKHNMNFHLYADDTQLFLSFDSCVPSLCDAAIIPLESCIPEIRAWMLLNKLMLNDDKTEFMRFLPSQGMVNSQNRSICIGSDDVSLSVQAKNLGVMLDSSLSLSSHITSTCKAANFHLYRLSRI